MKQGKAGRQPISLRVIRRPEFRLLSITLLIALSMVGNSSVSAQVECLGGCEAQLASCVRNSTPGNSLFSASCLETYEACVDACLGGYSVILG